MVGSESDSVRATTLEKKDFGGNVDQKKRIQWVILNVVSPWSSVGPCSCFNTSTITSPTLTIIILVNIICHAQYVYTVVDLRRCLSNTSILLFVCCHGYCFQFILIVFQFSRTSIYQSLQLLTVMSDLDLSYNISSVISVYFRLIETS